VENNAAADQTTLACCVNAAQLFAHAPRAARPCAPAAGPWCSAESSPATGRPGHAAT
jgi:hypothetical protein